MSIPFVKTVFHEFDRLQYNDLAPPSLYPIAKEDITPLSQASNQKFAGENPSPLVQSLQTALFSKGYNPLFERTRRNIRNLPAALQTMVYNQSTMTTWLTLTGLFDKTIKDAETQTAINNSITSKLREFNIRRNPQQTQQQQLFNHMFRQVYDRAPIEVKKELLQKMDSYIISHELSITSIYSKSYMRALQLVVVVSHFILSIPKPILFTLSLYPAYKIYWLVQNLKSNLFTHGLRSIDLSSSRVRAFLIRNTPHFVISIGNKIGKFGIFLHENPKKLAGFISCYVLIFAVVSRHMDNYLIRVIILCTTILFLPLFLFFWLFRIPYLLAEKVVIFCVESQPLVTNLANTASAQEAYYIAGKRGEAEAFWNYSIQELS